jgi:hypothetical protein
MNITELRKGLPQPPLVTSRWVRYLLSFGVSVAVGLSPYLGKLNVPLFSPLLTLIPIYEQNYALTLSSASIGIVAILVQWYGTEVLGKKRIKRMFQCALIAAAGTFLLLVWLHTVVAIPIRVLTTETVYVVRGFEQPPRSPCEGLSDSECVSRKLTLDPEAIQTHFGESNVRKASVELVMAYVAFTSSFAWLVGLIVFKE